MPPKNPNAEIDRSINELFKLMLYAHSEDMRAESIATGVEDNFIHAGKLMNEHLDNILLGKDKKKLTPRFKITCTITQMLRFMAVEYIGEINQIDVRVDDTPEDIISKLEEAGDDPTISKIVVTLPVQFSPKLAFINDHNKLQQILVQLLNPSRYGSNAQVSGKVVDYFINFMRKIAGNISTLCWMDPNNKIDKVWTAVLYSAGMSLPTIIEYKNSVVMPVKKPKKPKKEASSAPTADIAPTADAAPTADTAPQNIKNDLE